MRIIYISWQPGSACSSRVWDLNNSSRYKQRLTTHLRINTFCCLTFQSSLDPSLRTQSFLICTSWPSALWLKYLPSLLTISLLLSPFLWSPSITLFSFTPACHYFLWVSSMLCFLLPRFASLDILSWLLELSLFRSQVSVSLQLIPSSTSGILCPTPLPRFPASDPSSLSTA